MDLFVFIAFPIVVLAVMGLGKATKNEAVALEGAAYLLRFIKLIIHFIMLFLTIALYELDDKGILYAAIAVFCWILIIVLITNNIEKKEQRVRELRQRKA